MDSMIDSGSEISENVIQVNPKKKTNTLKEFIKSEPDVATFYKFVYQNGLRAKALEQLIERLSNIGGEKCYVPISFMKTLND